MDQLNFKEDIAIDPLNLDEEWLEHPGKFMLYSNELAYYQKLKDKAKEKIDYVRAQMDLKVRKNPSAFIEDSDKIKITESVISSAVILSEEYQEALSEYNELVYECNILAGAVRSFEHRKKALENEVSLFISQYFAGPKEPKAIKEGKRIVERIEAQMSRSQLDGLNKKKEARDQKKSTGSSRRSARRRNKD